MLLGLLATALVPHRAAAARRHDASIASTIAGSGLTRHTTLTATASVATAPSWQLTSAVSTIEAIERTSSPRPHSLLTGMFDEETGLCSEGVWHNSWFGVSRVLASRELRAAGEAKRADEHLAAARTLGDSLYRLSFDGGGFKRRSASGFWQSSAETREAIADAGEDPAFYEPSDEHRCISSGAAVIFFSLLAEEAGDDAAAAARATEVGGAFMGEFFDEAACRFRRGGEGAEYWRAADQAIGCLACLRLARLGHQTALTRAMASCAVDSLLREFGCSSWFKMASTLSDDTAPLPPWTV